jgi:hypothetical protein
MFPHLNRAAHKRSLHRIFFLALAFFPLPLWAGVTISSVTVSNSSPTAGSVIGVTVTYCEVANTTPFFLMALNPNSTTMQACPTTGQILLVDQCTGNTGTSPVNSSQADASDTCGGNGWGGVAVPNTPPLCPYTQVFNVTIPASLTGGGTYNLIVAAGDYFVQCSGGIVATTSVPLTLPLPAAAFSLTKSAGSTVAAPGSLILFNLNYNFVNTNNFVLTDQVPPNTTLVQMSAGASSTGSAPGSTITWSLGSASTPVTGTAWFLTSVNPATANGTVITNTASGSTNEVATAASNQVAVTVQIPQMILTKSESAASVAANSPVTYTLNWLALGNNLQIFDSYNNDSVATSGNSITGFDGTGYTINPAGTGDPGTWAVQSDAQGNHYIQGQSAVYDSTGATNDYPQLIRNGPGINICDGFTVQGDLQIPNSAAGATSGGDAHMILALNPSQGVTLKAAISENSSPYYFFIQKNNLCCAAPNAVGITTLPFGGIQAGVWYTISVKIQYSGSGVTYTAQIWPKGDPSNIGSFTYTDPNTAAPILSGCSGGWMQGWQADTTDQTDWFGDLQVYSGGPIINYQVADPEPAGVSFIGSNVSPSTGAPLLSWNFPVTVLAQSTPIQWWGQVSCPGPISNQFSMTSLTAPTTALSNTVNLTISGSCNTATPTDTPTIGPTATFTPTPTITLTPTPTPTITPTLSPTFTFTPTQTLTPTITLSPTVTSTPVPPTATNTPIPPINIWPIPFNPKFAVGGKLKVSGLPPGATVSFYTVSGELVNKSAEVAGWAYWDGTNPKGRLVSSGIYYYIVLNGKQVLLRGKLLFINE